MKRLWVLHIAFLVCLTANVGLAQNPDAVINRKEILIGEQAIITLSYSQSKENPATVEFPTIGDTLLEKIEVVKKSSIDTLSTGEGVSTIRLEQKLYITGFDSGYYAIRPFEFKINGEVETTPAFLLTVQTVEIDTTGALMADREIYEVNVTFLDYVKVYWKYPVISLAVAAVILLAVFFIGEHLKKRKRAPALPPPAPARPAHEVALETLIKIKEEQIYKRGKIKEYHTLITDTLRVYLQGQFQIPATELTSSQIIRSIKYSGIDSTNHLKLRTTLFRADLVKFAKEIPDEVENIAAVSDAIAFVQNTKPKPNPEENILKPEEVHA